MRSERAAPKPLRILHLEDDPRDTEVVRETLQAADIPIETICRVETESEFARELDRPYDVILADWRLPAFDGLEALSMARQRGSDVPFIMVSGKMGEEAAIESLKAGATDYVLKNRLSRLAPAVTRAVQQAEERALRLKAEAQLSESRHLLEAIIENSSALITVKDLGGRYLLANHQFVELLRTSRDAILGKTDDDLFPKELAASLRALDERAVKAGRSVEAEEAIPDEQGVHTYISVKCPICNSRGEPIAVCGISTDITYRKQVEQERELLLRETRRAVHMRDEFLLAASHELRTPMTPLTMSLETLQRWERSGKSALPPAMSEAVALAARQGVRLNRFIGDLFSISRMETGRPALDLTKIDLGAVVREVVGRFEPEIASARCPFSIQCDAPVVGHWDPSQIDQVVTNLFSNAIKFGAGKPIEVLLGKAAGMARLSVRDHGIGIDPAHQARIFERFERAVSVQHYGGLGLGLYLSRRIVDAHCGTIRVVSEPGKGSSFTVELPCAGPPDSGQQRCAPAVGDPCPAR